ncbi:hypothetical protein GCM10011534_43020 [Pseudooceanicola nanhaiensis]|uniref:Uncharacterized protein n=1 Tax=Pseudooceanicola nanhaiensis TaxID=375761 RepID=A0A917WNH7_9RHOB|nr:hypothetical protein GCM10011534_43020 [Pseudooceanicola nanhaiensis]
MAWYGLLSVSCGIGANRPKQLFSLIVTWKGPLLPHGLTGLGEDGSLPHPCSYNIANRQGGRQASVPVPSFLYR